MSLGMPTNWQSIEDEIVRLREETVTSRVKVGGPEWATAVKRCAELRKEQAKYKRPVGRPRKQVLSDDEADEVAAVIKELAA